MNYSQKGQYLYLIKIKPKIKRRLIKGKGKEGVEGINHFCFAPHGQHIDLYQNLSCGLLIFQRKIKINSRIAVEITLNRSLYNEK